MKSIIKKMESLQLCIEEQIAEREEIYDSRSEKWQDSDKGSEYQEKTERLQEMLDELIDWQTELGS